MLAAQSICAATAAAATRLVVVAQYGLVELGVRVVEAELAVDERAHARFDVVDARHVEIGQLLHKERIFLAELLLGLLDGLRELVDARHVLTGALLLLRLVELLLQLDELFVRVLALLDGRVHEREYAIQVLHRLDHVRLARLFERLARLHMIH